VRKTHLKNNRVLFAVRNKASKREEKEKGEPNAIMLTIENPEHEEKIVSVNNQKINNQKKK
jgi:hypothetical protein